MPHIPSLAKAAENIITRSFGLHRDQNLLIFADPDTLQVAEVVAQAAQKAGVITTILFVPRALQSHFGPTESLPLPLEAAIREADAVLSCLSSLPDHLTYRMRVLRTSWSRRIKLAHAPGMTLDILCLADVDYDLIERRCHLLATALVLGRQIEIVTADGQGRPYQLSAEIAGWDYTPGIGDGVIPYGAWANLPPGETFIVPASGDGQIVINGSVPGRVLQPGEELILTFRQGELADLQPENSPAARHLRDGAIAYAKSRNDPNWSNLAEIGFGVNPVIDRLTGLGLVDEKKDGAVHVALGESASLGGRVESSIHCDLVVERATVRVDGRVLLAAGQWRTDEEDWLPDYRSASPPDGWWASLREIRRSGARAQPDGDQLVREWNSGPGRWGVTPVGTEPTAQLAARLYQALPVQGEKIAKETLLARAGRLGLDEPTVAALLWVMRQYDLVRLPGERAP